MEDRTAAILDVLKSLPPQTLTTTIRSPRGEAERTFKGALLLDYAAAVDMVPKGAYAGGYSAYYFAVTAEDGFRVAVAFFEAAESISGKKVLLAYEQDGEELRVGVRLVVPGDGLSGRSIMGVVQVELHNVGSESHGEPAPSDGVELSGLVERPARLNLATLRQASSRDIEAVETVKRGEVTPPGKRYRGAGLYDLLESAGIRLNPAIHEDFLRKVIVVRSADGYGAVIAGGEIEPRFLAGNVVLATSDGDGALRDEDGRLRLIVPYDRSVARWVKGPVSIELREG